MATDEKNVTGFLINPKHPLKPLFILGLLDHESKINLDMLPTFRCHIRLMFYSSGLVKLGL
jgi:hypothetical protein